MNFPLKSDLKFVKNLKDGDLVYLISSEWNPNKGSMTIRPDFMIFKGYETEIKVFDKDNTTIMAKLSSNGKDIEKHNLFYGFYATPLDALNAFKKFANCIVAETTKAIGKEEKRLKGLVEDATKKKKDKE